MEDSVQVLRHTVLNLPLSFAYQLGGRILDYTYQEMMSPAATGSALHKDMLNVWSPENKNTDVPRMNVNDKYTNRLSDPLFDKL